jgi:hypothetical protein
VGVRREIFSCIMKFTKIISLGVGQMEIPEKLTIIDGFYFTDGGSIVLIAEEPDSTHHQITLAQHRFLEIYDPNLLPGRLYFNHLMVPVRSEMEAKLIALMQDNEIVPVEPPEPKKDEASTGDGPVVVVGDDLKEYYAKVGEGKGEVIQHLIENLINFVQSREYVRIAKKIEKKVNRGK